MKKGMELSISTLIIAIICLIVLVVIIAIFTGTINDIADIFRGKTDEVGDKADDAMDDFELFRCTDGERCRDNRQYRCENGEWIDKGTC